jgi:hypothetical protein
MRTRATEQRNGFGAAAKEVAEHASTIAKLELELAATELKAKAAALGVGVALLLGLKSLKRGTPPVPKQAIQEAKLTTTALKSDG